jgi:hypothetical protein
MANQDGFHTLDMSRRTLLARATMLAAGGAMLGTALAAGAATAASKLSQSRVNYQDKPRGRAQCSNCIQWQQPTACKIVDGTVSPAGWCSVYAPKS